MFMKKTGKKFLYLLAIVSVIAAGDLLRHYGGPLPGVLGLVAEFVFPAALFYYLWTYNEKRRLSTEGKFTKSIWNQSVINSVLKISLEPAPLDEMLGKVAGRLVTIPFKGFKPVVGIWLKDDSTDTLVLKAHRGMSEEHLGCCSRVPLGVCVCGKTALSKSIYHVATETGTHELSYAGMQPHGHYCVPIRHRGYTHGVINLYIEPGRQRNLMEETFLNSISEIIAGAIERKKAEEHVANRLRVENALSRASGLILFHGLEKLEDVLRILGTAVRAGRAYMLRIEPEGPGEFTGWRSPEAVVPVADMKGPISALHWLGKLLSSGKDVFINDVERLPEEAAAEREEFRKRSVRSALIVPIQSRAGELAGFLGFEDTGGPRAWSKEDARLLRVAGEFISYGFERSAHESQVRQMVYYDYLTGLPNRRLFIDRLNQAIASGRWKKRLSAVLFLDVDRFKVINDTLGHSAGDDLLKEMASRLRNCLHESDTVARLGGDEFTILLHEIRKADDVVNVIRKIFSAICAPMELNGQEVYATASIGVSIYPLDGESPEALLMNADTAMYSAKGRGRNSYRIFSPAMNQRALELLRMEGMLRRALERGEFELAYQPQADLRDGRISAVEVLARWKSPKGYIPPSEFIPVAEQSGLIVQLGEWVLRKACMDFKTLFDEGITGVRVAVNISSIQLEQEGFIEAVDRALGDSGLPPESLELEVTESVIMRNADVMIGLMGGLKKRGISISIDDFGIGYSSLNYLKRLPIDALKIDKSFVSNMDSAGGDTSIVIAIIRLAHSLDLKVVAEGVEKEEELKFLRLLECDKVQGYLLSKPAGLEEIREMIKKGVRLI